MIAGLSAAELLSAYRTGELSPVAVMRAVLAQAEAREAELHALCAVDAEGALAAARASETRWRTGTPLALDGVPVTLKENIAVPGAPYRLGTAATPETAVAGFEAKPHTVGKDHTFEVLGRDGVPRAGLVVVDLEGIDSNWLPYVRVADVSRTALATLEHGGIVLFERGDVAVLIDPTGAAIGVQRWDGRSGS